MLTIMKVNQEECDPLTSSPSLPAHKSSTPNGCRADEDVVVTVIAFGFFLCCLLTLTYGQAIFKNGRILQKSYQFLEIGSDQANSEREEGTLQEKPSYFVFPDLPEKAISEAITKKQKEERAVVKSPKDEQDDQIQKQKLKQGQVAFFREKSHLAELESAKHILLNLGDDNATKDVEQLNKREEFIYNLRYQIDKYPQELPFCVVVYSRDYNTAHDEHEALLRSILHQKYSNYRVVFIADAMAPETLLSLYKFILKEGLARKVEVVEVASKGGYARTVLKALRHSCRSAQVGVLINGNDQLVTQHVFSIYNAVYQKKNPKVAYGNYYQYLPVEGQIFMGSSSSYSQQEIDSASYREGMPKVGPLLTFNLSLVRYIDESYLKYDQNIFYEWEDLSFKALSLQLLELSCGKVAYIFERQYLLTQGKGGLEKREFVRQIHMQPRRCYEYEQAG